MRRKASKVHALKRPADVKRVANHIFKNYRNGPMLSVMFLIGCNTGLRASDIRQLTYANITSDEFEIIEQKTHKKKSVVINSRLREVIDNYLNGKPYTSTVKRDGVTMDVIKSAQTIIVNENARVFNGTQNELIGTKYMHKIINTACEELGIKGNFGSHTMRNTFAYHAYQRCKDVDKMQTLLNHSTKKMTRVYLADFDTSNASHTTLSDSEIYNINLG